MAGGGGRSEGDQKTPTRVKSPRGHPLCSAPARPPLVLTLRMRTNSEFLREAKGARKAKRVGRSFQDRTTSLDQAAGCSTVRRVH